MKTLSIILKCIAVVAGLLYAISAEDALDYLKFLLTDDQFTVSLRDVWETVALILVCGLCFCPNSFLLKRRVVAFGAVGFLLLFGVWHMIRLAPFEGPGRAMVLGLLVGSPMLSLVAAWIAVSNNSVQGTSAPPGGGSAVPDL